MPGRVVLDLIRNLMTVNILRLHRQFVNRVFDRTGLSKATRVILLTMGLSCPWLDRVFVLNQTSNCL